MTRTYSRLFIAIALIFSLGLTGCQGLSSFAGFFSKLGNGIGGFVKSVGNWFNKGSDYVKKISENGKEIYDKYKNVYDKAKSTYDDARDAWKNVEEIVGKRDKQGSGQYYGDPNRESEEPVFDDDENNSGEIDSRKGYGVTISEVARETRKLADSTRSSAKNLGAAIGDLDLPAEMKKDLQKRLDSVEKNMSALSKIVDVDKKVAGELKKATEEIYKIAREIEKQKDLAKGAQNALEELVPENDEDSSAEDKSSDREGLKLVREQMRRALKKADIDLQNYRTKLSGKALEAAEGIFKRYKATLNRLSKLDAPSAELKSGFAQAIGTRDSELASLGNSADGSDKNDADAKDDAAAEIESKFDGKIAELERQTELELKRLNEKKRGFKAKLDYHESSLKTLKQSKEWHTYSYKLADSLEKVSVNVRGELIAFMDKNPSKKEAVEYVEKAAKELSTKYGKIIHDPQIPEGMGQKAINFQSGHYKLLKQIFEKIKTDIESCHPDMLYDRISDYSGLINQGAKKSRDEIWNDAQKNYSEKAEKYDGFAEDNEKAKEWQKSIDDIDAEIDAVKKAAEAKQLEIEKERKAALASPGS